MLDRRIKNSFERARQLEAGKLVEQVGERFLDHVRDVIPIPNEAAGHSKRPVAVAIVDGFESALIACVGELHEVFVGRLRRGHMPMLGCKWRRPLDWQRLVKRLLAIASLVNVIAMPTARGADCLRFEPAEVTLVGSLITRTYAGPPNYESIERGDRPERPFIVVLDQPICVDGDPTSDINTESVANVTEVQVGAEEELDAMVGRHIKVLGTLFAAHTGHHNTSVQMRASRLVADEPPVPPETSASYLEALRVADSFLAAWVRRDPQSGVALMCEEIATPTGAKVKRSTEASWLSQYMRGLSNPHHQAFEVGAGKEIRAGYFSFPVTLYELYTGEPKGYRTTGDLGIALDGNRWCVATLPRSTEVTE